jgi:transcriptional regulator with XRE-family HTH domain
MNNQVINSAEEYLAFHELDLQNSSDLTGTKIIEATIPNEAVRKTRLALGLSLELMAVLIGVNLAAMIRYENLSLPPYPQGNVSRKLGLLINWMADATSSQEIINLLTKKNGLATLSGLLQTESVVTYMNLASHKEAHQAGQNNSSSSTFGGTGQVIGNA